MLRVQHRAAHRLGGSPRAYAFKRLPRLRLLPWRAGARPTSTMMRMTLCATSAAPRRALAPLRSNRRRTGELSTGATRSFGRLDNTLNCEPLALGDLLADGADKADVVVFDGRAVPGQTRGQLLLRLKRAMRSHGRGERVDHVILDGHTDVEAWC